MDGWPSSFSLYFGGEERFDIFGVFEEGNFIVNVVVKVRFERNFSICAVALKAEECMVAWGRLVNCRLRVLDGMGIERNMGNSDMGI